MKNRLYLATFSEDAIELIKKYNINMEYNHPCISSYLDDLDKITYEMKRDFIDSKAKKAIVHGPFTEIIPASIDPRAIKLGLERLNEAYEVSKRVECNRMVVHTGYVPLLYFKKWHIEKSIEFWQKFLEDKPKDFGIYIENVFDDEPYTLKEILDNIDDKRVRVCFDIGHANAMTEKNIKIEEWIEVLGPYISHLHIHNNYGKTDEHNDIFDGNMDVLKIISTIDEMCVVKPSITIESHRAIEMLEVLLSGNKY